MSPLSLNLAPCRLFAQGACNALVMKSYKHSSQTKVAVQSVQFSGPSSVLFLSVRLLAEKVDNDNVNGWLQTHNTNTINSREDKY